MTNDRPMLDEENEILSLFYKDESFLYSLPWIKVSIDRKLPFLIVYRAANSLQSPTATLISGESSTLISSARFKYFSKLRRLIRSILTELVKKYESALLIELWSSPGTSDRLQCTIHIPDDLTYTPIGEYFENSFENTKIHKKATEVTLNKSKVIAPPDLKPLFSPSEINNLDCQLIGIQLSQIFCDQETKAPYPMVLRALRRSLSKALKQGLYKYSTNFTTLKADTSHSLGKRALTKVAWDVDKQLASISSQFDFLLYSTPINTEAAWQRFRKSKFQKKPVFRYRSLLIDPAKIKKTLYTIPIAYVDDPTLHHLFTLKRTELDCQLTMLMERNTNNFLYSSMRLYRPPNSELVKLAESILKNPFTKTKRLTLSPNKFVELAEKHLQLYDFDGKVALREDIEGIIVTKNTLNISTFAKIPKYRVNAILHHEIDTHLLTYQNACAYPFQQLRAGLPGYEELQEGLAVLAEFLTGGLSLERLRILAARVLAVKQLVEGKSFVEIFSNQCSYGFQPRKAFNITMRVYRGGGLTKDTIYLRGLYKVMEFIKKGGQLSALFIGKISLNQLSLIQELQSRQILKSKPVLPPYLTQHLTQRNIMRIRKGLRIEDIR